MKIVFIVEKTPRVAAAIKKIASGQGARPNALICDSADFGGAEEADLIVVGDIGGGAGKLALPESGKLSAVILGVANFRRLIFPGGPGVQAITCGMGEKDTFIFSSANIGDGEAILSLQRSITDINGRKIEPFERKVRIPEAALGEEEGDLIIALAALVFCAAI